MASKIKNPQDKLNEAKKIARKNANNGALESFEETIIRFFRWTSSFVDKLFFTKTYAIIFAFLLSCLAYFIVNFNDTSFTTALSSSKTLTNVNVISRYNSESFEVGGLPETCDVTITGDAANVNNAATKTGSCVLNLEGYTEGTYTVELTTTGYGDSVNTIVKPSQVTVTLKPKTTAQFDLSYDFINQNQLDAKYILGTPSFASGNNKVNIRASQDTLNTIALVKALINVAGQTNDFEVEAPLVAYDANGKVVNAEIVPNTVTVKVGISSPSKTVPIKLNVTGNAPQGFSLESVSMNHQTTEIYASESILDTINEVTVDLNLSTVTSDTEIIQPVVLPNGVKASSVSTVTLKATLGATSEKVIENVTLNSINNNNGYGVSYADTLKVSLIIKGTQSNIDKVSASDFFVYVDFKDLEPGTYDLPISVNINTDAYVSAEVNPKNLNITLVSQE